MGEKAARDERLEGLLMRIREYEEYFRELVDTGQEDNEGRKKMDHQGTTAYINLVKLYLSVRAEQASSEGSRDPRALMAVARKILQEEYGVRR